MGKLTEKWCKYLEINGHYIEDCLVLKREIEHLIRDGQLKGYVKGALEKEQGKDHHELKSSPSRKEK